MKSMRGIVAAGGDFSPRKKKKLSRGKERELGEIEGDELDPGELVKAHCPSYRGYSEVASSNRGVSGGKFSWGVVCGGSGGFGWGWFFVSLRC